MTDINLTSPDGLTTIKEVVHNGVTFHLPPWISEDDFITSLNSGFSSEPLSSLISLTLNEWVNEFSYEDKGNIWAPYFNARFRVPLDSMKELVLDRFAPAITGEFEIEYQEDSVIIGFRVGEYYDFNDIQVIVLPKDFINVPCPTSVDYLEEIFYDLMDNFDYVVEQATTWGGLYEEFEVSGEKYFLLIMVHED